MRAVGSIALVIVAVAFGVSPVRSADIKPAVVFDIGGKFDKSFNEGVHAGAEKFTTLHGKTQCRRSELLLVRKPGADRIQ